MKVLFICSADHKYGSPRMALSLIQKIEKEHPDINFIVLTPNKGFVNDRCDELRIENYVIPYGTCLYKKEENSAIDVLKRTAKRAYICAGFSKSLYLLKKHVAIDQIDLIHTNLNRDLFGEYLVKKYHIPHIVHMREFCNNHSGLSLLFHSQIDYMNRYTDRFVAISGAVSQDWESFGIDKDKTVQIYDGVDTEDIYCHQDKKASDPIKIAMCGGIYPGKGQRELLEAARILRDRGLHFVIDYIGGEVGRSGYYGTIEEDIKEYDLADSVHMLGYRDDVHKIIRDYDIGVVCSKTEGFGLVTVEYMLANLCPVVSNTGANCELVQDGESGLIYKWGDANDLADKIAALIQNPDRMLHMAGNARVRAISLFSLDDCVERLVSLYYEVTKNHLQADR